MPRANRFGSLPWRVRSRTAIITIDATLQVTATPLMVHDFEYDVEILGYWLTTEIPQGVTEPCRCRQILAFFPVQPSLSDQDGIIDQLETLVGTAQGVYSLNKEVWFPKDMRFPLAYGNGLYTCAQAEGTNTDVVYFNTGIYYRVLD